MKRATLRCLPLIVAVIALPLLTGCGGTSSKSGGGGTTKSASGLDQVNHIVFLAEENRSFDHYFGKINDYRSAAPFNLRRDVNGLPDDCSPTTGGSTPWTTRAAP